MLTLKRMYYDIGLASRRVALMFCDSVVDIFVSKRRRDGWVGCGLVCARMVVGFDSGNCLTENENEYKHRHSNKLNIISESAESSFFFFANRTEQLYITT